MSFRENDKLAKEIIQMLEVKGIRHEHITYLLNCHFSYDAYHSVLKTDKVCYYRIVPTAGFDDKMIYQSEITNV